MKQKRLYKVTICQDDVITKLSYRGYSKQDVREKAMRDKDRYQRILSIEEIETSKERVFLTRSEVADIYGVDPQTVTNYVTKGVLKPCSCSNERMMFDINMVDSLRSSVMDIQSCDENIQKLREELQEVNENISNELEEARTAIGININSKNGTGSKLLKAMVAVALGNRYERMFNIVNDYLFGTNIKDIAHNNHLSSNRTIQIINNAFEILNTLRPYDEVLTENDMLKAENSSLKRQIVALQAELQTCASFNEEVIEQITDEDYHYHELFHKKLEDLHLSTRTLKSLQSADINKIGELVQYDKLELLKLRNFGKKSLTEIEDIIEDMDLYFGMYDKVSKIEKKFMMKSVE